MSELQGLSENQHPQELPAGYKIDERNPDMIVLYAPDGAKLGTYNSFSQEIAQDAIKHAQESQEPAFKNEQI